MTFSPRLGLRANIISGDRNPNDPNLQTFNPLFPRGKYFGEIGLIGPSNLIDVHPTLTLQLNKNWTLDLATVFYWRESLGDGIYGPGGDLVRPSDDSGSRYIGTQADVTLGWQPVAWFSAALSYSVFVPGLFIQDTGPSNTAHFVGVEAMLKF
jgi:Alginate export